MVRDPMVSGRWMVSWGRAQCCSDAGPGGAAELPRGTSAQQDGVCPLILGAPGCRLHSPPGLLGMCFYMPPRGVPAANTAPCLVPSPQACWPPPVPAPRVLRSAEHRAEAAAPAQAAGAGLRRWRRCDLFVVPVSIDAACEPCACPVQPPPPSTSLLSSPSCAGRCGQASLRNQGALPSAEAGAPALADGAASGCCLPLPPPPGPWEVRQVEQPASSFPCFCLASSPPGPVLPVGLGPPLLWPLASEDLGVPQACPCLL